MAASFKLNRTQFNQIAKRFVSSDVHHRGSALPYLIGDHIMASNSSTAVLIRRQKLNHPYIQMGEDASTKAMLEMVIEGLFTNFEVDISLVVNRDSIKELVKFLKHVRRNYNNTKVEIYLDEDKELRFIIKQLDDKESSIEHTVACDKVESTLYDDEHFTITIDSNNLIDTMMTLRDSDVQSTFNFSINEMSPVLFTNSTLQIIVAPVR